MAKALMVLLAMLMFLLAGCWSLVGPSALIEVSVKEGPAPLEAAFDGSKSVDPDGKIVTYRWDLGDGEVALGVQVVHTYQQAGSYSVVLEVTDDSGATGRATTVVRVLAGPGTASGGLVYGDFVLCQDQVGNGLRVAEVLWVRSTHARLRLMGGGHGEIIWEKDYGLSEIVKLSQEQVNALNLIPDDYYTRDDYGILPNTLDGLELFLANFRYTSVYRGANENPAKPPNPGDPFEATEMAAALECGLEDAGFDARLVMGPTPEVRGTGDHAWILVFLPSQTVAIEPTEPSLQPLAHDAIITAPGLSMCPYYCSPENEIFYDIYTAVTTHSLESFNWWLVTTPP